MNDMAMWMRPGSVHFASVLDMDDTSSYSFGMTPLPGGWTRQRDAAGPWTRVMPDGQKIPDSGWKLHIAARLDRADEVLSSAAERLLAMRVGFKHLSSPAVYRVLNAKYAPRASAGKLIAVYPPTLERFDEVVDELSVLLDGEEGPGILTDLALGRGPLHARYGAFRARRRTESDGSDAFVMSTPAGDVADRRELMFRVPASVALPDAVAAALAERDRTREERRLPYRVTGAMHFSNGGGVYDALDESGRRVALKEGRRHTGIGPDGSDAALRVRHEHEALKALADLPCVPAVLDWLEFDDRVFLVEPFVAGGRAIEFVAKSHPGTTRHPSSAERAAYAQRVSHIVGSVAGALAAMHRRGWVFGDLHPGNLIIDEDDCVTLIDFETAQRVDDAPREFFVPPGFTVSSAGIAADLQRLELLKLWFLAPENAYWEFSDAILERTVATARRDFDLGRSDLAQVCRRAENSRYRMTITPIDPSTPAQEIIERGTAQIAELALAAAEGGRPIPVGPGAISWSLAAGSAGALLIAAEQVLAAPEIGRALAVAVDATDRRMPGLFSGISGAAVVLHELGETEAAHRAIERADAYAQVVGNPDLERGLYGVALSALRMGRTDIGDRLARRARKTSTQRDDRRVGLLRGPSGEALAAVRLFEATADSEWLAHAEARLSVDLQRLHLRDDGVLLLDHGNRKLLPNLAHGALGVAYVAGELAAHRPSARFDQIRDAAGATCLAGDWATQGLFDGRAGAVAFLAATGTRNDEEHELLLSNQAALVRRFTEIDRQIHFPGISGLRFSYDLAAGMAGALWALMLAVGTRVGGPIPGLTPITPREEANRG